MSGRARRSRGGLAISIAALAAACGPAAATPDASSPRDAAVPHDAARADAPSADAGPIDPSYDVTGVPCDVARVLGEHCTICHTQPLTGDAPFPLVTYAEITEELIPGQASSSIAPIVAAQMQSGAMPPGPAPHVPTADAQLVADWVSAGAPPNAASCPPTSPYEGTRVCTSGATWTRGDEASPLMHPGGACLDCHARSAMPPSPMGTLAGTVYATVHEPDDCNGVAGSAADPIVVTVRGHDGQQVQATADEAGNFYATDPVALPIEWATVTYQGRTRAMASPQPSADCNACHTERGLSGAPGRIVLP